MENQVWEKWLNVFKCLIWIRRLGWKSGKFRKLNDQRKNRPKNVFRRFRAACIIWKTVMTFAINLWLVKWKNEYAINKLPSTNCHRFHEHDFHMAINASSKCHEFILNLRISKWKNDSTIELCVNLSRIAIVRYLS